MTEVPQSTDPLKSSEWQPTIDPRELIDTYVANSRKKIGELPQDVELMLSEFSSNPFDAVCEFVIKRIENNTVTDDELLLLTPWFNCPELSGRVDDAKKEWTKQKVVEKLIAVALKKIDKRKKEIEPLPFSLEYAGATSAGGRDDDEDAIFLPGQFTLAEIYRAKENDKKTENLAVTLLNVKKQIEQDTPYPQFSDQDVDALKDQIDQLPLKIEELIAQGKFAGLYIVADGAGGHDDGAIASSFAVFTAASFLVEQIAQGKPINHNLVNTAIQKANEIVYQYNHRNLAGTKIRKNAATTIVLAVIDKNGKAFIGNVGDSRAYHLFSSGQSLQRITTDHSQVEKLAREGEITRQQTYTDSRRNILTKGLSTKQVIPDIYDQQLNLGDCLILCCDGVWEGFPPSIDQTDQEVHENLRQAIVGKTPAQIVKILTASGVGEISEDNTSAVAVKIK